MKILITGGTTFVSKYAAEYFVSQDNDVTVINRGSRPQVDGVTHINCDRTALGERLNGKHFDLILDITAYTEEHIKTLLESGVIFDDYIFISSSAVYPEINPPLMITFSSAPALSIPRSIRSRLPRNSPAAIILSGVITE